MTAIATTSLLTTIKTNAVSVTNTNSTYVEVSTNTTPPVVSDTTLGGTTLREANYSSSTTSNTVTTEIFLDGTEFNGNTINKVGTFDAVSGGNLLAAANTNALVKDSDTEVFIGLKITYDAINN